MLVCRDKDDNFHIIRRITKSGMSLHVETYCEEDGFTEMEQFPDEFLGKLHGKCQSAWNEALEQA